METTNYWHALDRTGLGKAGELEVDPLKIGISHGIGDVGEGLKANVFRGLRTVELGFFGTGKGFRSQPTGATPESFGTTEREDMRQLARINEVELSTHAAPDLGPLSGFTGERFSKEAREASLQEVHRALDFAADTARGGAVVVHIGSRNGEFPRTIYGVDELFQAHPEEEKRAPIYFVDKESGRVQALSRNMKIFEPVPDPKKPGEYLRNPETGMIEVKAKTFDEYKEEKLSELKHEGVSDINVGQVLFGEYIDKQKRIAEGESLRFDTIAEQEKREVDILKHRFNFEKKIQEVGGNVELARDLLRKDLADAGMFPKSEEGGRLLYDENRVQNFMKEPEHYLQELIERKEKSYRGHKDIALARAREVAEVDEMKKNTVPIDQYALPEIKDSLARAALEAYRLEKERGLEKPLFVSPENWSPESYGSHPKEFKKIILESREEMANRLVQREGMKFSEAKKIADDHIRGTFDVGHLNFWRKYFKGTDAEFRQWVDKEVDELTKDNVIGNVHLSDNFGYHDEHLAPGQGNAPIEKFVEKLEKSGYTGKYIAEPGGQKEGFYHTAWTGALNVLRSPVYRVDSHYARWSDIEQSYFGLVPQSPGFLVGDIVPSKDWTLWSETPLE